MSLKKIGRVLFGSYFVYSGINHFLHEKELAKYARAKNIPYPDAAVIASGIALVAGGASIALGLKPKFGAASIVGFLTAVTPTMHDFWNGNKNERQNNMVHFGKNLALLSGALGFADHATEPAED
jgi:putative oxidoreductase